jgi:Putative metal-binding motif
MPSSRRKSPARPRTPLRPGAAFLVLCLLTAGLLGSSGCSGSKSDDLSTGLGTALADAAADAPAEEVDACSDGDGDGFGEGCAAGPDCDDENPDAHVALQAFRDDDGDGYGGEAAELCAGDEDGGVPQGYATRAGDCDDTRADVSPDEEVDGCDDVDTDCDDAIDEDRVPVVTRCGVGACANEGESRCSETGAVDNCAPGAPPSSSDATCDGVDDDCDGRADEDYPVEVTRCTNGACSADGQRVCQDGTPLDTCVARVPSTSDSTCDGVDDDCDGRTDEDFAPQSTACGRGACVAGGSTRCEAGRVVDSCAPLAPAPRDTTCDRRDDDCDGEVDEEYASATTSCGSGACRATGSTSCINGSVVDDCRAGAGGASDGTCDGVDDDCDGRVDDDYVARSTSCGTGACARQVLTTCSGGREGSACTPGTPSSDANCNGVDDDCDGQPDDAYTARTVSCGVGACVRTGATSCAGGVESRVCTPGAATGNDSDCDGIDDDCNGVADDKYVPSGTRCGVGACSATGTLQCIGGRTVDTCSQGAAGSDGVCDGIDNDCNGQIDEDYAPRSVTCGVGACQRTVQTSCVGGRELGCTPGAATGSDNDCDGIDDDCNGVADDKYAARGTSCGVGACAARGATSCVSGVEQNSCRAGTPAANDATCNNLDDDCNGQVDEDYRVAIRCGVGACVRDGVETCSAGQAVRSCTPGTPAGSDATCNNVDDDCNGQVDEDFAGTGTRCGTGACARSGTTVCTRGSVVDGCTPGSPAASDATCNNVDDDCNGVADDDFAGSATSCGVGECASTGTTRCLQGTVVDTCAPRPPTTGPDLCNGRDDDCDGRIDDDYTSTRTTCSLAQCTATGSTSCVSGREVDSCVTPLDSCDVSTLTCAQGQACGRTRCTGTACGCAALACTTGRTSCVNGQLCTGADQCGTACGCRAPTCRRGSTIVGSDEKSVYYGMDECGGLCAPAPRCDHTRPICGSSRKEECGVDLVTGGECECAALTCQKTPELCVRNLLCFGDVCGNRCGQDACVDSCGSRQVCSPDGGLLCDATCDGTLCNRDKCTTCARGCDFKNNRCL